MESFSSSQDILLPTVDLPVYLVQQLEVPSANIQQELIAFLDHRMGLLDDDDQHWDLRMGNALAVLSCAQHPDALALCVEIHNWVEDASPYLSHKTLRLMESALNPQFYLGEAQKWLRTIRKGQDLHLALTILCARSEKVDENLETLIRSYWQTDPAIGARLMALSKNEVFFKLLENELTWLTPFLRYLPVNENLRPLAEHELWSDIADAWFAIAHSKKIIPAWLDPRLLITDPDPLTVSLRQREWQEHLDAFLIEKFSGSFPWTSEEWIESLPNSDENNRWKQRFIEAQRIHEDSQAPTRKGLRLVKNVDV